MRFLLLFTLLNAAHAKSITCTHIQVCNATKAVLGNDIKTIPYIIKTKDHHHESLTIKDRKVLEKAKMIFSQHQSLSPWVKRLKTTQFPKSANHQTAHFWLSSKHIERVLGEIRFKFGILVERVQPNLKVLKPSPNTLYVLTHDGLSLYFSEKKLNYFSFSNHSDHHHHGVSPKTLKAFSLMRKNYEKVVWIIETQFHEGMKYFKKYASKKDLIVKINTEGQLNESPYAVINEITEKLNQL